MVEDRKIDRFAGPNQASHRATVGLAGARIPARMIVGQNNAHAAQPGRIDNDFADGQSHRLRLALVTFDVETAGRRIDMRDP